MPDLDQKPPQKFVTPPFSVASPFQLTNAEWEIDYTRARPKCTQLTGPPDACAFFSSPRCTISSPERKSGTCEITFQSRPSRFYYHYQYGRLMDKAVPFPNQTVTLRFDKGMDINFDQRTSYLGIGGSATDRERLDMNILVSGVYKPGEANALVHCTQPVQKTGLSKTTSCIASAAAFKD